MTPYFGEVITALITPFTKQESVDFPALEKLIGFLCPQHTDAVVVNGTTGESPTLTPQEKWEILSCVRQNAPKGIKVIMGTGSNNTQNAIELSQTAQKYGADGLLSVVPYYNKPSQEGMTLHFGTIAQKTNLPIIIYNIPGRTGVNMAPKTVAQLAHQYDNIVAIKQSCGDLDLVSEIKMRCPDDFALYSGDDSLTLPMLSLKATGVVSVAAHLVGADIRQMIQSFKAGHIDKAWQIHQHLFPLFKNLFIAPNPVPIKYALAQKGMITPVVRLPLCPVNENDKKVLDNLLPEYLIRG